MERKPCLLHLIHGLLLPSNIVFGHHSRLIQKLRKLPKMQSIQTKTSGRSGSAVVCHILLVSFYICIENKHAEHSLNDKNYIVGGIAKPRNWRFDQQFFIVPKNNFFDSAWTCKNSLLYEIRNGPFSAKFVTCAKPRSWLTHIIILAKPCNSELIAN